MEVRIGVRTKSTYFLNNRYVNSLGRYQIYNQSEWLTRTRTLGIDTSREVGDDHSKVCSDGERATHPNQEQETSSDAQDGAV